MTLKTDAPKDVSFEKLVSNTKDQFNKELTCSRNQLISEAYAVEQYLGNKRVKPEEQACVSEKYSDVIELRSVSQNFSDFIEKELDRLPNEVLELIRLYGTQIIVAHKMQDYNPQRAKERPRGWKPGRTWSNADGMYDPDNNCIVVCETLEQDGVQRKSSRTGVLLHETAHFLDHKLQRLSSSPEFISAYMQDLKQMSASDRSKLAYFVQGENDPQNVIGREETFAEIWPLEQSNRCASFDAMTLRRCFPSVAKQIRQYQRDLTKKNPG
jgi:hypothetical protein